MMAFHGLEWVLSTQVLTDCSQKSNFFEIGIMKNSERQKCPDLENRKFHGSGENKKQPHSFQNHENCGISSQMKQFNLHL